MTAKIRAVQRADILPAEPDTMPALPAGMRLGQQTAIEQSRAVAEVQGAIIVAQRVPRNVQNAIAEMRAACTQPGLADRAFYRYSRAGSPVTGATVHLARELARCWGNVQYGIGELDRDDAAGMSQMLAWAWDVQTNTRASSSFMVPHRRDTKTGVKQLTDMRDIYENNANSAARRLREQIFAILPVWFTAEAKDLCSKTLANPGDGKTREQRIADAISVWQSKGITVGQLEDKLGRRSAEWTDPDLAQLRVVWTAVGRGETTLAEEFPAPRVTAEEITAAVEPPVSAAPSTEDAWADVEVAQPPAGDQ